MIGPLTITLNAARPGTLPLPPVEAVVGSASTLYIYGAPGVCTSLSVRLFGFDGVASDIAATAAGNCWVVTLPAVARYGKITGGLTVIGSGQDETGAAREWILGVGDYWVYNTDGEIAGGEEYTAAAQLAAAAAQTAQGKAEDAQAAAEQAAREAESAVGHCVPDTRKVNGKALSTDITLTASDVGAVPTTGGTMTGPLDITGNDSSGIHGLRVIEGGAFGLRMDAEYGSEKIRIYDTGQVVGAYAFPYGTTGILALLQNLAANYSTSATYAVNDLCVYFHKLYRCTTAIETAELWTAAHWTVATVQDVLAAIRTALADKAPLASPAFTGTPTAPNLTDQSADGQVANKKYVDEKVAGVSVTPLSGQTFDFSTMQGVFSALKTTIEALGGTVTNAPTIPQGE